MVSVRKMSFANGEPNPGHKHKAPDHNHGSTQPLVDLPTHKLRLDAAVAIGDARRQDLPPALLSQLPCLALKQPLLNDLLNQPQEQICKWLIKPRAL